MSEITLDCKTLPCPQPVLKAKEAIETDAPERLVVTVDNDAAKDNVSRFLSLHGYEVETNQVGSDHVIIGTRNGAKECEACTTMPEAELKTVGDNKVLVFIASDVIGTGDDELGGNLMFNFLATLKEMGSELWRIVMVNSGVKLATKDHRCVEELKRLEESGVSILVCGTCLEFFSLGDQRQVGEVTNMLDIVTSFQLATKTIRV